MRNRIQGLVTLGMMIPLTALIACSEDSKPPTNTPAPSLSYREAALQMAPDHYYPLDETRVGAVANLADGSAPGIHEGDGTDVEPDVGDNVGFPGAPGPTTTIDGETLTGFFAANTSIFCNNALAVNLGTGTDFGHPTMTVALWIKVPCDPMNPGTECQGPPASSGGERIFTNNFTGADTGGSSDVDDTGHFQIALGWGANFIVSIDNRFSEALKSNYQVAHGDLPIKDNRWHHIVASRNGDDLMDGLLVVDGVEITKDRWVDSTDSWGVTAPFDARIGTRPTAPHDQTFNGWIDEVAIWLGRQLTVEESQALYQSAIG